MSSSHSSRWGSHARRPRNPNRAALNAPPRRAPSPYALAIQRAGIAITPFRLELDDIEHQGEQLTQDAEALLREGYTDTTTTARLKQIAEEVEAWRKKRTIVKETLEELEKQEAVCVYDRDV
ncbi:hypothetical protein ACN47E_010086 [Coniothyrium glycines]